ncbi:alpha/beta hydrolase [Kitasatospora sp. NPDC056327]|uniref:alpha/beta hydrolase n=1 Tax=Kitasatospora sp. NPDC056327 TaxID=3345785 RepID=UPI0035DEA90B
MNSHRAARPRLLPAALAAGGLLLATACQGNGEPSGERAAAPSAASAPASSSPATAPAAAPTPTPTVRPKGAEDPALKPFYGQRITWAACPPDPAAAERKTDLSAMRCGRLRVPLDYTDASGETLELALIKNPAARQDQRLGSLMVNPGGPGASGIQMVKDFDKAFRGALHDRYDVVGFDPRGTGESSPVACLDDRQRDAVNAADEPADPQAAKAQAEKQNADFIAACQARSGRLLPFVGTRNTARDLDVLRAAVGDPKLNYLGVSYGTYLGAVYAEEFPATTGRLVLDGAVDPSANRVDGVVDQVIGFDRSFQRFAADCVEKHAAECPLGKDPAKAAGKAADFLEGLREKPLPTESGRGLGTKLAWTGVDRLLYGDQKTAWQYLRYSLAQAMTTGRGDYLLAYADDYNGRDAKGHYSSQEDAFNAVRCADGVPAPSAEEAQRAVQRIHEGAPVRGGRITVDDLYDSACPAWPVKPAEQPHTIRAEGAAPILVVGTTGDPATPYAAAEALAKGFADATLLTLQGEGHGAFGAENGCIDAALAAYLTEGTLPAAGTRCS